MKIEQIKTRELVPYANNAKLHSDEQVKKIAASIKEFKFNNPVLIDADNGIIAGHGRVLAAELLKLKEVPCIRLGHLTEAQKKAYILADNRLGDIGGGWNEELLKIELEGLKELDFNIDLTGFDDSFVEEPTEGLIEDDEIPEVTEPRVKLGEVWQLGNHRLLCGDCTDRHNVERLMNGKKADLVFTDPPYGISIVGGGGVPKFGKVGGGGVPKFGKVSGGGVVDAKTYSTVIGDENTDTAKAFYDTCVKFGFKDFIIWGGNYFTDFLSPSPCWIVWDKENIGNFADVELAWCSDKRGAKLYKYLWNGMSRKGDRKSEGATRVHPTQKPVGLFVDIFKEFSFNSCFDGFGGSGSTLIACEKLNRTCYMMELSPEYCDVIINRWQQFTGETAVKL